MTLIDRTSHRLLRTPATPLWRQWQRNYTTRKTLRRLTAVQLADIGVSPDQAQAEARRWFWQ